jgi:hypothetical protein
MAIDERAPDLAFLFAEATRRAKQVRDIAI